MVTRLAVLAQGLKAILTATRVWWKIVAELFITLAALVNEIHVVGTVHLIAAITLLEVFTVDGLATSAVHAGTVVHCTGLLETAALAFCRQGTCCTVCVGHPPAPGVPVAFCTTTCLLHVLPNMQVCQERIKQRCHGCPEISIPAYDMHDASPMFSGTSESLVISLASALVCGTLVCSDFTTCARS